MDDDAPLFPDHGLPDHIVQATGPRRAQLVREWRIGQGDLAAKGGRVAGGAPASRDVVDTSGSPDTLWDVNKLEEQAQLELQKQLRHGDPKIRRDAAKELIDFVQQQRKGDQVEVTQIVYLAPDVAPQFDVDAAEAFAKTL